MIISFSINIFPATPTLRDNLSGLIFKLLMSLKMSLCERIKDSLFLTKKFISKSSLEDPRVLNIDVIVKLKLAKYIVYLQIENKYSPKQQK